MAKMGGSKNCSFWNDRDWMEWQANAMSSAFLMPKAMVLLVAREAESTYGSANPNQLDYLAADAISEKFNVSHEAAFYRLQKLGMTPTGLSYSGATRDFLDFLD
jgi:Zn-dependent peptidase ImmA (M78 family)